MNRDYILGKEKISKALMKLSIPATIAMLVNAIYNIVDTMFIGRGVGSLGIAGLTIYLPIQIIILSFGLLIGVGTGSIVSRKLGSKDLESASIASGNLFLTIGSFGIITSILGFIFAENIVKLFGATGEVIPYATNYARAMFPGVLVFPLCVASNNLIRAEGNAKDAMNSMIIGMIANIFLDYLFIYVFKLGLSGAGIATSISKGLSFLYVFYYFLKKSSIKIKSKYLKLNKNILKEILSIGSSAFTVQISMSIVTLILNYSLYRYGGNKAISVYGIVYKLTLFIQMPLSGLIQGMQPLVGFNLGCQNISRIKETIKINLIISTLISAILTVLILLTPDLVVRLFTTDKLLIEESSKVLKIIIIMYPILGIYMTAVGFYQSIGRGKESLILSLLRQIIFFIPLSLILPSTSNLGILGIWIAFPISDLLSSLCSLLFAKSQYKKIFLPTIIKNQAS